MILRSIQVVAVALWIGGMAALDFIDAPLRFASSALDRNQAVAFGQAIFARFNRVEMVLGVIVLGAAVITRSARWTIAVAAVMLGLVVVQSFYLTPAITRLAAGLDFVHRTPGDPRYAAIRPLHTAYAVLEVAVFAGGVAVLAGWTAAARR